MTLKFIHININIWQSLRIVSVRAQEVLTLTMRELRHWPSIAGCHHKAIAVMRRMGVLNYLHDVTIYVLCFLLCAC